MIDAVGDKWILSANVTQADLEDAFGASGARNVQIRRFDTPAPAAEGFDHVFAATAESRTHQTLTIPRQRGGLVDEFTSGAVP